LIRERKINYTFEECKTMLEIIYNVNTEPYSTSSDGSVGNGSDMPIHPNQRMYQQHLMELNELMDCD
jgi:hypothetical protein